MLPDPLRHRLQAQLQALENAHRLRTPPRVRFEEGMRYQADQKKLISFCSNDYLGFASDPLSINVQRSGSSASRLIHGDHTQLRDLESTLASKLGYEDAILCQSGYLANLLALGHLPQLGPAHFYSDALNHRSIIDALILGRANKKILPHLDPPPDSQDQWWICESRYSMDGDAPTRTTLEAHLEAGGYLYLDEAHRFGLEPGGTGLAQRISQRPTLCNIPLGKSFGLQGAFLVGPKLLLDWLRQISRPYIYTTAISPLLTQAIAKRMDDFFGASGEQRRQTLHHNLELAAQFLQRPILGPITPIPMASNAQALQASQALADRGFHVQAIRPPTVPEGEARLRITWSAAHTRHDIESLAQALRQEGLL